MDAPSIDAPTGEWLVYGDSLQTKGDPRGALIAISHAIAEGKADASVRDAYLAEHAAALLGKAAPYLETYRFDWKFCVPLAVRVRIGASDGDRELALLDAPLAQELRALTLVGHTDGRAPVDLRAPMTALQQHRLPHLTKFGFVDERAEKASMLISRDFEPRANLVTFGSLLPFVARAEEVHVEVADSHQLELSPLNGPKLVAFTLNSLRFADYEDPGALVGPLAEAVLPKIERFRLRLTETWFANIPAEDNPYLPVYSERYHDVDEDGEPVENRYETEADDGDSGGVDWGALDGMLGVLAKAPLRELALTGFESSRSLVEALDRVGFAPSLEVLDLSDSSLTDADCAWIAAHPATFGRVRKLVVERTRVTEIGATTLRKLRVEVVHGGAHHSYRYVVGSE